jgi:hypothetical protein
MAAQLAVTYNGDDQQLVQVKWEKYMRTLQVKMAPDYNFSTKSVSLKWFCRLFSKAEITKFTIRKSCNITIRVSLCLKGAPPWKSALLLTLIRLELGSTCTGATDDSMQSPPPQNFHRIFLAVESPQNGRVTSPLPSIDIVSIHFLSTHLKCLVWTQGWSWKLSTRITHSRFAWQL